MIRRSLKLPQNRHLFLFGPRQVGKSTLIKETFSTKNTVYYNLLNTDLYFKFLAKPWLMREEIEKLNKKYTHIVIDEIQRVPELLNEVHNCIETMKNKIFILSGSSARKLKREGANMLGGRALTYNLYPLTHQELAKNFDLARTLELGSLPAIYLDQEAESLYAKESLRSYVRTYIEEEIKAEAQLRNLGSFLRFLDLAASENGQIINYSNIASDIHSDYKTVQEYYQVLEDTLIGFSLKGYSKSTRKQLSKHPKFYFFDTGVQRAIAKKLDAKLILKTRDYGESFEHYFIAEFIRLASYSRKDFSLSYYRSKSGAEVDLIVETGDSKCFAIEIKSSDNVETKKLSGLKSFKKIRPEAELICASLTKKKYGDNEITIYPWQEVFKSIFN